ncbi:MAG: YkgJ family cysteine cluster protein [Promethearchaeota archaeon]
MENEIKLDKTDSDQEKSKENRHPSRYKDMQLIRKGKCNPKKCNSACCKIFMHAQSDDCDDYNSGFLEHKNKYGDLYTLKNCKHLDVKNNKCKIWGTKEFPKVCKVFPFPNDSVYKHVFDVCSFKFEMEPTK